jgi:hypothetical protein
VIWVKRIALATISTLLTLLLLELGLRVLQIEPTRYQDHTAAEIIELGLIGEF